LEDVKSAFDGLSNIDEYQQRTISGRDDFLSLSSDKDAEVGRYSVEVKSLASHHKIMSSSFYEKEAIGEGKLSIASGDNAFEVLVSDSATLSDIRDAINDSKQNTSVSATIITDDSGQRLVLNSKRTGIDNSITINTIEESNKLTSTAGFTPTDTVGSGTLSFGSGGNNFDILVGASDTLSDILTAINDSTDNTSVVASIVTDGGGHHLVFNSIEPGAENAVTVTSADDDGGNADLTGISQFASVNMDVPVATNNDNSGLSRLSSDATNRLSSVNGFTSSDTIGAGTLSFSSNGNNFNVIASPTNTLKDIMEQINDNSLNTTVRASIVNDNTGDHLVFSSRHSGATHAITVTAVDGDGNNTDTNGISQFISVNQTAIANIENMTEVDVATDASITIDGTITVSNSTNNFKDVIDGVDITVNKAHTVDDDISKIEISENNDNVAGGLNTFITSFNALVDLSKQLGQSNEDGTGPLSGDSLLRGVMTKLRSQFNKGFDIGNGESLTLSQLGVRTERSGHLSLDKSTLDDLLEENPDKVQNFFIGENKTSGFVTDIQEFIGFYTDSDGLLEERIEGKTNQIKKIDSDLIKFKEKMDSLEARLLAQYNAMDLIVGQMKSTSSYLMTQLDNMPGVVRKSK